jgi:homoserine O-acetyltransferase/O-succinyltransferase
LLTHPDIRIDKTTRYDMPTAPIKEYADSDGAYGLVETQYAEFDGITLESGVYLGPLRVAYETYGQLSPERDNAVLILHALSGDAHVAGVDANGKLGWWDAMIGPGKGIDTNRYFVICSNCLGGCKGTTGPPSINPATGKPYGRSFPLITMGDMVDVQAMLMRHLGIAKLHNVIGGSMGGMQALEWAVRYPEAVRSATVIAATARLSPQGIAFNWVGRNAIYSDPARACGDERESHVYQRMGRGLAVARMIGHITYLSEETMEVKFGRKRMLKDMNGYSYSLGENGKEGGEFEVESYLEHQGSSFMRRFDEDSYIIITKAIDYFDLEWQYGDLVTAFKNISAKMLVMSYNSDWLYPTSMSLAIVRALQAARKHVSFVELDLPYGHDSFLVSAGIPSLTRILRGFLNGVR